MPGPSPGTILRHVRQLALPPAAQGQTDAQLLRGFAQRRDETAFAALMQRHGGLVWGVCRHVLTQEQDAEDAFQATFLALARHAATIRTAEALAGWLHGTAFRVAMRAKRDAGRRRNHERRPAAQAPPASEGAWRELQAALDEEVERLPERQRAAFVVCVLEGKTLAEAGQLLGWSPGTVSGTLARARQRLRRRLARRGITLSALLTGLVLADKTSRAAALLAHATLRLALGDAAAGAVPPRVATLAQEVTKTMLLTKTKGITVVLLALALAAGSGTWALWARGSTEPPAERAEVPKPASGPAADSQGDPLPPGAVGRLGTVRFRHAEEVEAFALSPDGKRLATAGGRAVVVWDAVTGQELCRFEGHRGTVRAVAFAPDGKSIASGAEGNLIRLWDAATGKELRRFEGHGGTAVNLGREVITQNGVYGLVFTPDGKTLVSRGADQTVRVWEVATGKELRRIEGLPGWGQALAVSPDGKTLAAAISDFPKRPSEVRLWELATGNELRRFSREGVMTCVAFSPDGKLVAAGWGANADLGGEPGGDVTLWEVATGKPAGSLRGHKRMVVSVAFAPDGKTLLSGSMDWTARLWDVGTARELGRVGEGMVPLGAAAFSPDGRLLVMRTGYAGDHTVRFWDVAAAKEVRRLGGHRGNVISLAFSPDSRLLASGSADRAVGLWDVAARKELRCLAHDDDVLAVALSEDGRAVRAGGIFGGVRAWDVATGKEAPGFKTQDGYGPRLALSPDGKILASWPRRGEAGRLWDATTGKELRSLKAMPQWVNALAFSRDGRLLAVGSGQGPHFITLWDVASGRLLREFAEQGWVLSLAFSPDGRILASGHDDKKVRLWEVATGGQRFAFDHGDRPAALAFSPGGTPLASACNETRSNDKTGGMTPAPGPGPQDQDKVRVWDPFTGARLATLAGHQGAVVCLAFSPDGRLLASGSNDTTILLWDAARLPRGERRRGADLSEKELAAAWADLSGGDAAAAFRALRELSAAPRQAVGLLKEHLRPVAAADPKQTARLIADLDGDDFDTRERAARELEKLGEGAEGALRKALAGKPSAEAGRRIEALLNSVEGRQNLEMLRGVEVLERLGTAEARELLETLARGAPGARLTREAKAALERRARRAAKP
jgi:RNA polymerase sigma factor (sigma-70 family)